MHSAIPKFGHIYSMSKVVLQIREQLCLDAVLDASESPYVWCTRALVLWRLL